MMKFARNIMFRTRLFLANVRNTPRYEAFDTAELPAKRAVSPRAIVKQDSRKQDKKQNPGRFNGQPLYERRTLNLSQQHGGREVGQVHQRRQLDDRPPRRRQHVQWKHMTGEEEAE